MDNMFDYDAPKTFANLYEMANANDDGADKFFGKFLWIVHVIYNGVVRPVKRLSINHGRQCSLFLHIIYEVYFRNVYGLFRNLVDLVLLGWENNFKKLSDMAKIRKYDHGFLFLWGHTKKSSLQKVLSFRPINNSNFKNI